MTAPPTTTRSVSSTPVERRRADLARLADERWDLVIVGGGIVGSGALLDATSRGLRAALVEQTDIAAGTSSRSSRLIHGGLRYLEQFRFGLVREALAERRRLLRLAPHLVRLEPLLFPLYGNLLVRPFYDTGLTLYDLLGAARDGGWHRHLSTAQALEHTPSLRRKGLRGAFLFHDGVEDDARLALAVARTANAQGGLAATRVRATELIVAAGRAAGITVRDELSGQAFQIRANAVIDGTGVWSGQPDGPFPATGDRPSRIRPSRGSHLVVPRKRIPSAGGMTIRVPGKVVFLVPWPGYWLIGTTDVPYEGPPDEVMPTVDDVDEILAAVNGTLDVGLTRSDVVGAYAGLRPLVGDGRVGGGSTLKVSREHRILTESTGLVRIGGGKYTTYRVMARDVVDAALGGDAAKARPSGTAEMPLTGAASRPELDALAARLAESLEGTGLERRHADRLVARHGTQAADVVALGERLDLLRAIAADSDHLEVEVVWAARAELALSLADVLVRRTRLAQEQPDRAASIAPRVAALLGAELGWDAGRQGREIETYLAAAHRDFDVPEAAAAEQGGRTAPEPVSAPAASTPEPVSRPEPAPAIDRAAGPAA